MEPWKALLVAFGGNVTLLFLLGYFGRSLVSQVLAKDIEKFKADLQLAAVEHQVRFSKLHERRAEILAELYELLVRAIWTTSTFTSLFRWEGDPEKNDQYVIAMDAITKYFRFFDRNRIWLPTEICGPLENFAEQIRKPTVELGVYLSIQHPTDDTLKEQMDVWHKAWNSVQDDIPELRREIEERFRSVLDADSKTNR